MNVEVAYERQTTVWKFFLHLQYSGSKKTICLERLEIDVPIHYHYILQCKNNDKKQINFDICGRFDSRFICRIHF